MKRENCMRCGRHNSEVPLSEYGDVCVRCEESLREQLGLDEGGQPNLTLYSLAVLAMALPLLAVQVLVEVVTHGG